MNLKLSAISRVVFSDFFDLSRFFFLNDFGLPGTFRRAILRLTHDTNSLYISLTSLDNLAGRDLFGVFLLVFLVCLAIMITLILAHLHQITLV